MSERNRNIDIVRALALLIVLVYHFWVLSGSVASTNILLIDEFIKLGGEIGVTIFFLLSGYGIYWSIDNSKLNNNFSYKSYIIKRLKRILPEYYVCLFLVLILTDNVGYLTKDQILNVLSHCLFIHNLFPSYAGSINGVLWTMGVIFQFYLLAPFIYKAIKNKPYISLTIAIIFTCLCKFILYRYVLFNNNLGNYAFFAGRQIIISVIDNFVVGMVIANIIKDKKLNLNINKFLKILLFAISLVINIIVYKIGLNYGIHSNNLSGYIWHSLLAISLGLTILIYSSIKIRLDFIVTKIFLWIAHYEYGIYLWHLVITINIINKAPFAMNLISKGYFSILFIILLLVNILVGYVFSIMIQTSKISEIFHKG